MALLIAAVTLGVDAGAAVYAEVPVWVMTEFRAYREAERGRASSPFAACQR